eukprot:scaffold47283_cov51-Phaeocystis_antarctica.AAC.1
MVSDSRVRGARRPAAAVRTSELCRPATSHAVAGKQQKNREEHDGVEGRFSCRGVRRSVNQLDHVASVRTRGGI